MEDKALHTIKAQKNKNPRKFYTHFIFKAVIVTIILVVIPIFPSEAPDFITPSSISTTIWELFCPIVVGVVVTYGLFSSKNDNDHDHIKTENGSTFDHAQSYIAKYLHVPSIYDDDDGEDNNSSMSHDDDCVNTNSNNDNNNKKVQTWSSKYHRNQPSIVVVDDDDKTSRVLEKPLLLPVRSLKSRVCDVDNDAELMSRGDSRMYNRPSFSSKINGTSKNEGKYVGSEENKVSKVYNRSNSSPSSRGFSNEMKRMGRNGSGKSRLAVGNEFGYCDEGGGSGGGGLSRSLSSNARKYGMLVDDEKNNEVKQNEETVVLPSPIPWRSRSGRMENNGNSDEFGSFSLKPSSLEEMRPSRSIRSQSSRSSRSSSSSSSGSSPSMLSTPVSSPKKLSPSPSVEFETLAKSNEDSGRKMVYSSRLPPPPPPPPPPPMYGSRLMKASSAIDHEQGSSRQKEFKRSVWSEPRNIGRDSTESMGKSVRTVRAGEITGEINGEDNSDETDEDESFSEFPKETTNFLEQVLAETDDESESDDEIYNEATTNLESDKGEKEEESNNFIDESPDVDKKADEFIAKFREQIRLQRIESIKRSTGQLKRNGMR